MSSYLFVPHLACRAFLQIHALEDGIRSHTFFDVENCLLKTLLLVQLRLFRRFLFFQRLVIRKEIGLFLRGGGDILLVENVSRHDGDAPDQQIRVDAAVEQ